MILNSDILGDWRVTVGAKIVRNPNYTTEILNYCDRWKASTNNQDFAPSFTHAHNPDIFKQNESRKDDGRATEDYSEKWRWPK